MLQIILSIQTFKDFNCASQVGLSLLARGMAPYFVMSQSFLVRHCQSFGLSDALVPDPLCPGGFAIQPMIQTLIQPRVWSPDRIRPRKAVQRFAGLPRQGAHFGVGGCL